MNRLLRFLGLAVMVLALGAGAAWAGGPGTAPGNAPGFRLPSAAPGLVAPADLRGLDLTDAQRLQIRKILAVRFEEPALLRPAMGKLACGKKLTSAEKTAVAESIRLKVLRGEHALTEIWRILEPGQRNRLRARLLSVPAVAHRTGLRPALPPELAKALTLTPAQEKAIAGLLAEERKAGEENRKAGLELRRKMVLASAIARPDLKLQERLARRGAERAMAVLEQHRRPFASLGTILTAEQMEVLKQWKPGRQGKGKPPANS